MILTNATKWTLRYFSDLEVDAMERVGQYIGIIIVVLVHFATKAQINHVCESKSKQNRHREQSKDRGASTLISSPLIEIENTNRMRGSSPRPAQMDFQCRRPRYQSPRKTY